MSGSVTYTAWSQGGPELPSTNLLLLHSHPSLHRNANGIVSPVLLSCWAEDLACLSNFVLQSREPSTSRRARKLYTVVFTIGVESCGAEVNIDKRVYSWHACGKLDEVAVVYYLSTMCRIRVFGAIRNKR